MSSKHYFEKGDWRKATKEESIKYKKQYTNLHEGLRGWYFGTVHEWIEEVIIEGKDRLLLVSRDDNGKYGVCISCDIDLSV